MLTKIINSGFLLYKSDANMARSILGKIPFLKNTSKMSEKTANVLGVIFRLICEIVKKSIFVGLFMFLPRFLAIKFLEAGIAGFGIEDVFVYLTVILICFCGSINNSVIFAEKEADYVSIRNMKINSRNYYRFLVLRRSCLELVSFFAAFSIWGMNPAKSAYLALLIVICRFFGDTFRIFLFRMFKKTLPAMNIVISIAALFFAYFFPYIRGYVPGAYNIVFDSMWIAIILSVGTLFIYFVWVYSGYSRISEIILRKGELIGNDEPEDDNFEPDVDVTEDGLRALIDEECEEPEIDYDRINRTFYNNNKRKIIADLFIRCAIVFCILVVVVISGITEHYDFIYKVITYALPAMFFVVHGLTVSGKLSMQIYCQVDNVLLSKKRCREKNEILTNFLQRLPKALALDLISPMFLVLTTIIAGCISHHESSFQLVAYVAVGIILISIFYTFINFFVAYIIQPFKLKNAAKISVFIDIVIYLLAAGCIYINVTPFNFLIVGGLVVGVTAIITVLSIQLFAVKTYRNKD